ncbi:non-ribosomal peptide synthetase [Acetobacterium wieringae]|uniref:non-ribosomal peptide synthetase n=1 Tax=Acetobacterium wieringae TaxID=52694 RepID=UPI002B1F5B03|nr:non-ribosomal peptide synthetase [Acetobacterium wieringae]MEA4804476.1 non-ribosomal peptide synthetase [Acetobacterium wieringae]
MNIQDSFIKLKTSDVTITYLEADGQEFTQTYATLFENAIKVLGGYQSAGLKKGSLLVFQLKSIQAQITCFWAGILGGMVPAILPLAQDEKSRAYLQSVLNTLEDPIIISDLEGVTTLFENNLLMYRALTESSPGIIVSVSDTDPGMIQFTSGTSSDPKGAVLTTRNLQEGGIASSIIVRDNVQERYLSWLPLSHCFGFVGYHLVPIVNNFPQYLMSPLQFVKNPNRWLEKLSQFSATVTGAALFGIELLLKVGIKQNRAVNLDTVYICFCGGEDVNPLSLTAFEDQTAPMGWARDTLKPAYGLSETTMGVAYTPYGSPFRMDYFLGSGIAIGEKLFFCDPDDDTIGRMSVGVLDECNEVVIKDLAGNILDPEYLGLIHIRGTNVMQGYYSKTKNTPTGVDEDVFFNTGDLGFFRNGWLNIFGRYKDIIIVNGENYLVSDLEKTGKQALPENTNLIVVQGKNRNTQDNCLILFSDSKNPETLTLAGQSISAIWQLPIKWGVMIDEIPRTTSGKINRLALAVAWENGDYDHYDLAIPLSNVSESTLDGPYNEMANCWADVLKISPAMIGLDSHFIFDLGGDSLGLIDLINQLEQTSGIKINTNQFRNYLTLTEMTNYILSL